MAVKVLIFHIFLIILLHNCQGDVKADRVKKKIYQDITGLGTCFRRLNGTHEVGCSSGRSGNVGVVHYILYDRDLDWLIDRGTHQPYVALIHPENFKWSIVNKLAVSGKVNGLIILDGNHSLAKKPLSFTPDSTCPNDDYGLYKNSTDYQNCKKTTWNPDGTNMLFMRFDFPVFVMLNQTEVDFVVNQCYIKFNKPGGDGAPRDYPLCAAEVKDIMDAAVNTETCRRRTLHITNLNPDHYCDPLGDQNVFSTMKFVNKTEKREDKSIIIAATRLDASSLFDNLYPGADVLTGVVALLAAAEAIGKVKGDLNKKDIMFTFFQGEAYGYIGSSRMVYDMEKFKFPREYKTDVEEASNINMSHISHFIEVNQVGLRDGGDLWIHTDPISSRNTAIKKEVDDIKLAMTSAAKSAGISIGSAADGQPLPPASFQSFLSKRLISGIVLTDHQTSFTNKYYNSRFDEAGTIGADYPKGLNDTAKYDYATEQAKKLTKVATTLANTLYTLATGNTHANLSADEVTVSHLLFCYLFSPKCDLFRTVIDVANVDLLEKYKTPFPLYVGVDSTKNAITKITRHILAYFTGDLIVNRDVDNCTKDSTNTTYSYIWMQGREIKVTHKNGTKGMARERPICIRTLSELSAAVSPAFKIKNYKWGSGDYSTWTESVWPANAMSVRVFLLPSQQHETVILAVGVIVLLVSMLLVYFINARANILFGKDRSTSYMS
ncbi:nicastrin-like [Lineus longissimus]|uniref:nicastrin-like n=1 Tax=Lineus longissimus TaxID=88925 RepID=UPI002B4F5610